MAALSNYARFLDAEKEPRETLIPISGYEQAPLVSLRQAIQPLGALLFDVETMAAIAIRNCCEPEDGLTVDESSAIHLYTMQWPSPHVSLFTMLNERLRSPSRELLTPWYPFMKLFLTALHKLPSFRGTVWRGVRGNLSPRYKDDQIWWAASSCTEDMQVMERFTGNDGVRTIFNIECLNGKVITAHSYFKEEKEIVLPPGSYFKVAGIWSPATSLYMVHLQQRTPPHRTIASPFVDIPISVPSDADSPDSSYGRWNRTAVTVVGHDGLGSQPNQLSFPRGIAIDDNSSIYVADWANHRIAQWTQGAPRGTIVASESFAAGRTFRLSYPTDVVVDREDNSLIICDRGNRRVVRFLGGTLQTLVENIACYGLAVDGKGRLYVSDSEKNEVRRWRQGEEYGTLVAGGNRRGSQLNQLSGPTYIFVDDEQSVYVSDTENRRVMKWRQGASEGVIMAESSRRASGAKYMFDPQGVIVDRWGRVYVADLRNACVMRWSNEQSEGEIVVGGHRTDQLNEPRGITFDAFGNLYVADYGHHRIQKFERVVA